MRLPGEPNLEHLRGQAKRLLRAVRESEAEGWVEREDARAIAAGRETSPELARDLVRRYHPRPPERFTLADAQLVVARAYGFASWPKLVAHIEVVQRYSPNPHRRAVDAGSLADRFVTLACLTYGADDPSRPRAAKELLEVAGESIYTAAAAGDPEAARPHLAQANVQGGPHRWEPILYLTYSRVAGDGSVELARMLLDAGADGGVWHRRLGAAHPTPQELVQDLLLWSLAHGMTERIPLILAHPVDVDGHGTGHPIMQGHTALEQGILDGDSAAAAALRQAGAASWS